MAASMRTGSDDGLPPGSDDGLASVSNDGLALSSDDDLDDPSFNDSHIRDPNYVPDESTGSEDEPTFQIEDETVDPIVEDRNETPEVEPEVQRSRKRKRDPISWACNVRKRARAQGGEYLTRKGKRKPAKKLKFDFDCRQKCATKVSIEEAEMIHRDHLNLGDKNVQYTVIQRLTSHVPVKQRCNKEGVKWVKKIANEQHVEHNSKRHSYSYSIKRRDGSLLPVCKKHFCSVNATTSKELIRIHKFVGKAIQDGRKGRTAVNVIQAQVKEQITEHILSFPRMSSHYSRHDNPNRRYLNPNVGSIRNTCMWLQFLEKKEPDEVDKIKNNPKYIYQGCFKEWLYRDIFHDRNLKIGYPRTDTCAKCDRFAIEIKGAEAKGEPVDEIQKQYDLHIDQGDAGYEQRALDKDGARQSWVGKEPSPQAPYSQNTIDMYTFDYKKNFLIPNLRHNDIYYQRQLCIYVFGVHDCVRTKSLMYYYPEVEMKKGGSEVASLVYNAVTEAKTGAKHCIFYTDGCGGQNRNRDVMTMFQTLTDDPDKKLFDQIDHKIHLRGHTRLPNDTDFAKIDEAEQLKEVHLPSEYEQLIRDSVRGKGRFSPIKTEQKMVFDMKKTL